MKQLSLNAACNTLNMLRSFLKHHDLISINLSSLDTEISVHTSKESFQNLFPSLKPIKETRDCETYKYTYYIDYMGVRFFYISNKDKDEVNADETEGNHS